MWGCDAGNFGIGGESRLSKGIKDAEADTNQSNKNQYKIKVPNYYGYYVYSDKHELIRLVDEDCRVVNVEDSVLGFVIYDQSPLFSYLRLNHAIASIPKSSTSEIMELNYGFDLANYKEGKSNIKPLDNDLYFIQKNIYYTQYIAVDTREWSRAFRKLSPPLQDVWRGHVRYNGNFVNVPSSVYTFNIYSGGHYIHSHFMIVKEDSAE